MIGNVNKIRISQVAVIIKIKIFAVELLILWIAVRNNVKLFILLKENVLMKMDLVHLLIYGIVVKKWIINSVVIRMSRFVVFLILLLSAVDNSKRLKIVSKENL